MVIVAVSNGDGTGVDSWSLGEGIKALVSKDIGDFVGILVIGEIVGYLGASISNRVVWEFIRALVNAHMRVGIGT